jgi:hypothetical protein
MTFEEMFDQHASRGEEITREAYLILKAAAVVECFMCDDEGYRRTVVCDHVDRTEIVAAGMRKVRSALKLNRKAVQEES